MGELKMWWNSSVDYDWLLAYHRSHPFLRRYATLMSAFGALHTLAAVGLLLSPDLIVGTPKRAVVATLAGVAFAIFAVAFKRQIETKRASLAYLVGSDIGTASVLMCITPSPFSILAAAIFTGIGNYAATFHGGRIFATQQAFAFAVLVVLVVLGIAGRTWPVPTLLTAGGTAFIILFTSSIVSQALVSHLRQDAAGAYFDPLTGLRNRRGLIAAVKNLCLDRRSDAPLWAIAIDLDGFKTVNDRFGHDYGDQVLQRTASRIEQACQPPSVAARVGGEEFTVVGFGTRDEARTCADRIVASVYDIDDDTPITASLGVANSLWDRLPTDIDVAVSFLTASADAAMYRAKDQGGHRVVHADPSHR
ncbi:GGDEF domain-containing protein [Rhodococcus sp. IEGM 1330]|uniref:GGDEF domain-containing protein n=1 Tax=Rhodococcus sp. IEGM 1330 TaxID=3082225 RepID=UPI0029554D5D|nr:GGDEF domain-containing protein [Rhodococcus sp. IEGM 1330]MDV8022728.1 GGDEF domain-containing protein [Rhodococcus sp. IEGM 1330]